MKQEHDFIQCIEFSDFWGGSLATTGAIAGLLSVPPSRVELCRISDTVRSLYDGSGGD